MARQKIALVTGASSGMGKVIAKQLILDGLHVVVAARTVERMTDLAELGAYPIALDVSNAESVANAVRFVIEEFGTVDVLVNNAGFGLYGAVEDVPLQEARYQFDVNLFGVAHLTQALLPSMRAHRRGTIINISSVGGKIYTPLGAWYHASKHALEGWSDCLRLEVQQFGIDVVVVEPGLIQTRFGDVVAGPMQKFSGRSAYAEMANRVAASTAKSYQDGGGSPPQIIADVVSRAVKSSRPKTRYVAGKFAVPLLFMRKWFGDRIFDRIISNLVR